jgi:hypothetical protein
MRDKHTIASNIVPLHRYLQAKCLALNAHPIDVDLPLPLFKPMPDDFPPITLTNDRAHSAKHPFSESPTVLTCCVECISTSIHFHSRCCHIERWCILHVRCSFNGDGGSKIWEIWNLPNRFNIASNATETSEIRSIRFRWYLRGIGRVGTSVMHAGR